MNKRGGLAKSGAVFLFKKKGGATLKNGGVLKNEAEPRVKKGGVEIKKGGGGLKNGGRSGARRSGDFGGVGGKGGWEACKKRGGRSKEKNRARLIKNGQSP